MFSIRNFSLLLAVSAIVSFSSCIDESGCMDPDAVNYDPEATVDNGECGYYRDLYLGTYRMRDSITIITYNHWTDDRDTDIVIQNYVMEIETNNSFAEAIELKNYMNDFYNEDRILKASASYYLFEFDDPMAQSTIYGTGRVQGDNILITSDGEKWQSMVYCTSTGKRQ